VSQIRQEIEGNIDGSSDAVVLRGVAKILEGESIEADREGYDAVADLYRTFCARLESMAESLEPSAV
jgi:hypothetical protein